MKTVKFKLFLSALAFLSVSGIIGCADPYGSQYPSSSYPNSYGRPYDRGYGYGDPYYRDGNRDERREIERERREIERERERTRLEQERYRFEQERRRVEQERNRSYSRPQERCPSGFSPSEQKCSREERKRGCRDMRLPGGLGCVDRR